MADSNWIEIPQTEGIEKYSLVEICEIYPPDENKNLGLVYLHPRFLKTRGETEFENEFLISRALCSEQAPWVYSFWFMLKPEGLYFSNSRENLYSGKVILCDSAKAQAFFEGIGSKLEEDSIFEDFIKYLQDFQAKYQTPPLLLNSIMTK